MTNLKEVGVWLDDSLIKIDQKYIDLCKANNINSVAIMVNKSNTNHGDNEWEMRYKKQVFVDVIKKFKESNIDVTLTCWPRPSKKQNDLMFKDIEEIMNMSGACNFEVDTEGNWSKGFLNGFKTMQEAADYLGVGMKRIAHSRGMKASLTTFPYHQENSASALIGKHMDTLYPQAYSVYKRDDKNIEWTSSLGPGRMQKLAINRASKVPGFVGELGCGLAAYDQEWPNHTGAEAMKAALEQAVLLGVSRIRFWSSKWLVGSMATKYGMPFLKTLRK